MPFESLPPHPAVRRVKERLGKEQIDIFEPFAGSGIVARALKKHASRLVMNDLEDYAVPIGECYLANRAEVSIEGLGQWNREIRFLLESPDRLQDGFLTELAPSVANQKLALAALRLFFDLLVTRLEWVVIDLFRIPGRVRQHNSQISHG